MLKYYMHIFLKSNFKSFFFYNCNNRTCCISNSISRYTKSKTISKNGQHNVRCDNYYLLISVCGYLMFGDTTMQEVNLTQLFKIIYLICNLYLTFNSIVVDNTKYNGNRWLLASSKSFRYLASSYKSNSKIHVNA